MAGGIIYLMWRGESLLMFAWFDFLGLSPFILLVRHNVSVVGSLPDWFKYSLPNALWLFGGILFFSGIWERQRFEKGAWVLIFLAVAFGSEFAQVTGCIPGTYDNVDVFFMVIFTCMAYIVERSNYIEGAV